MVRNQVAVHLILNQVNTEIFTAVIQCNLRGTSNEATSCILRVARKSKTKFTNKLIHAPLISELKLNSLPVGFGCDNLQFKIRPSLYNVTREQLFQTHDSRRNQFRAVNNCRIRFQNIIGRDRPFINVSFNNRQN